MERAWCHLGLRRISAGLPGGRTRGGACRTATGAGKAGSATWGVPTLRLTATERTGLEPGQGRAQSSPAGAHAPPRPAQRSSVGRSREVVCRVLTAASWLSSWPLVSCGPCPPARAAQSTESQPGLLSPGRCLRVGSGVPRGLRDLTVASSRSAQNRGRLADKRTLALPAARVLKKELTPSFSASDGDSDASGPACGQRLGLKQETDPHIRIMKRRYPPALGTRWARGHQDRSPGRENSPGLRGPLPWDSTWVPLHLSRSRDKAWTPGDNPAPLTGPQ